MALTVLKSHDLAKTLLAKYTDRVSVLKSVHTMRFLLIAIVILVYVINS